MWGDSESVRKNTSIYMSRKFSELINKKFLKIWASDLVKADILSLIVNTTVILHFWLCRLIVISELQININFIRLSYIYYHLLLKHLLLSHYTLTSNFATAAVSDSATLPGDLRPKCYCIERARRRPVSATRRGQSTFERLQFGNLIHLYIMKSFFDYTCRLQMESEIRDFW